MDKRRIGTFLVGGAAGVIAGILLAPRSGRELRGSISNRAGEARERGRESYFDVGERVQERISRVRDGGSARSTEDETLLGTSAAPEEPPMSEWPPLRDVSRDAPVVDDDPFAGEDESVTEEPSVSRSEELRRKVRETRARLDERRGDSFDGGDDPL